MRLLAISQVRNADAAFKNVCEFLDTTFNITDIDRLVWSGTIAGSEFETYAVTKLYVFHQIQFSAAVAPTTVPCSVVTYDEVNAADFVLCNQVIVWNATTGAINYIHNHVNFTNYYFSRLVRNQYTQMSFNGYRLTIA